jgi:hypothetical protein
MNFCSRIERSILFVMKRETMQSGTAEDYSLDRYP